MTIGELKALVRSLVGDAINYTPNSTVSFGAQTYSDTQLDASIFHAFKIYAGFTDSLYKEYTGIALDGNGFGNIPTQQMGVLNCIYGGISLVKSDVRFEYMKNNSWQSMSGTPTRFVEFDGGRVRVIPKPITSSGSITLGIIDIPNFPLSDAAEIDNRIQISHQDHLKLPAAAYLLTLQGDQQNVALGANYIEQFRNLIMEK